LLTALARDRKREAERLRQLAAMAARGPREAEEFERLSRAEARRRERQREYSRQYRQGALPWQKRQREREIHEDRPIVARAA
jgi:hypothetical protein